MDEKKNNTAETPAFKAPENAPVRRVGTLTLGVCLIVCGVLFLCYFFVPHFNWELALKIAPAAGLILLGCEVLYFAARPQRWKYDFLSVFLCIVLMVSAFGGACLMAAFDFALRRGSSGSNTMPGRNGTWTMRKATACALIWTRAPALTSMMKMRTAARPPTRKFEPYKKHITAIQKIPFTGGTCPGILNVHPDDGCSKKKCKSEPPWQLSPWRFAFLLLLFSS